jgi:hypothetical protein
MGDADLGKAVLVPPIVIEDLKKRFHGFPVPDGPFNPATASQEQLREFGLPPRPDPVTQPLLRQIWDRGFGEPLSLQQFSVDERLVEETGYRPQGGYAKEQPIAETRFETSLNWSGAYITANRAKEFVQIWGIWTIPSNLKLPPDPFKGPEGSDYVCSNWIGLDGQRRYLDSSLPQIGTSSTLQADGAITAQAWTQWWARERGINNTPPTPLPPPFNVAPGDQVMAVLTVNDPRTVTCVMVNLSTQPLPTATSVNATVPSVQLPDGTMAIPEIAGATAEWIVERPAIPGQSIFYNLPNYGVSGFDLCMAVEGDGVEILSLVGGLSQDLQGARFIRMYDRLKDPWRTAFISMPERRNDTAVQISYGGFSS